MCNWEMKNLLSWLPLVAQRRPEEKNGRAWRRKLFFLLAALLLPGCHVDHKQSMLHPAGPAAAHVASLWWVLFVICTLIFVIVMILAVLAVWRWPGQRRESSSLGNRFIVGAGIIIPSIILVVLLLVSLGTQVALTRPTSDLTIEVIGHRWWWEVKYPDHGITTANEIHIPVGVPVHLRLKSSDVIHSFWVPNLAGKLDMLPDHFNHMWLQADAPGEFRGQCGEFCGVQHALMAFKVIALPKEEFQQWLEEKKEPVPEPETEELMRGKQVFFEGGCSNCHAIRGTEAKANIGPDLTHVGSRKTIAAGVLPNNRGNLTGWVVNAQAIKPGNRMPRTYLPAKDLNSLIDYLMSLE